MTPSLMRVIRKDNNVNFPHVRFVILHISINQLEEEKASLMSMMLIHELYVLEMRRE